MLADVSGDEVENYLITEGIVHLDTTPAGVPTNAPCSDAQHAAQAAGAPLRFHA